MTQPNPGATGNAAPQPTDPPPTASATGTPPAQPTTPPPPPGLQPAAGNPAADDGAVQRPPAAAPDAGSDPNQLGDAGKRALEAERERAKKAEAAAKEQQKQLTALTEQLNALKPAAELFAQFRKVAVPEAEKTDLERLQEELAQVRNETQTERQARWRLEVATEKGLTREQAAELRGSTEEELAAHADRLLKLFPKAPAPPPPTDPPATEPAANGQQPAAQPEPASSGPRPDPSQGARGPVDINAQIQDALAKGDIKTSIALKQQLAAQQRGGTQ